MRSCLLLLAGGMLLAEDPDFGGTGDGRQLYLVTCAGCHGPDGDSVPAADLAHGRFRRASSDEGLAGIIRSGIKGTSMPPHDLSQDEIGAIVRYLRYLAATARSDSAPGDAARGKAIFDGAGNCLACHRVKDKGSRLGPDLTEVGSLRRAVELEQSVVEPDAEILPPNRFVRLTTLEGAVITGRLLNRDGFSLQIIDSSERLRSFQISNLKGYGFLDRSPMPSYRGRLSPKDIADLVSYLVSLKGLDPR